MRRARAPSERVPGAWTRELLEARVEELAGERETFVVATQRLAERLDERERELLGRVLLERANREHVEAATLSEQLQERSWLRRMWDKSEKRAERLRAPGGDA